MQCGAWVPRLVGMGLLAVVLLVGSLLYALWLSPWGNEHVEIMLNDDRTSTDAAACLTCSGVNAFYPITSSSHPSYGRFFKWITNHAGTLLAILTASSIILTGLASFTLDLIAMFRPNKRRFDGGVLAMLQVIGLAQFVTVLGALRLAGMPRFVLESARQVAWTNLQTFFFVHETTRHEAMTSVAAGVPRYAAMLGVERDHLFYYSCVALAAGLAAILVLYVLLRILLAFFSKSAAGILDHHVIWVFIQLFVLLQYSLSMTSLFEMRDVIQHTHAVGDFGLAILVLALGCGGTLVFGFLKIARHRDLVTIYATAIEDVNGDGRLARAVNQPFHLRYSVFYRDVRDIDAFFFVVPLIVDLATGAIVAWLPTAMFQLIALLVLHSLFVLVVLVRQPFAHIVSSLVTLLAAFAKIVVLLLALSESYATRMPQHARDTIGVVILSVCVVVVILLLVVQLGLVGVAVVRFITSDLLDDEVIDGPITIEALPSKSISHPTPMTEAASEVATPTRASASPSFGFHSMVNAEENRENNPDRERHSRSLYAPRRPRRNRRVGFTPVDDDELPEWARV